MSMNLGGVFWNAGRQREVHHVRVTRKLLRRVVSYFRPYWFEVAIAMLAALFGGMVVAPAVGGLFGVAQAYFNTRIAQKVMFDLRNDLYRHVQSLSLRFFTEVKTGEIMSRLNNDVSGINRVLGQTLTQNVSQLFVLITTLVVIFTMD